MRIHRIENVTNGYWLKRNRAEREIRDCTAAWVETGVSIRNLTPAEMVEAMNIRAQERDRLAQPLPDAEIRGFHFLPSVSGIKGSSMEPRLIRAALGFAAGNAGF
jgi:hypothetical protein